MSKLYGKIWADGNPGKLSTRQGHKEITMQTLYGNKSDSRIACEITVTWDAATERFFLFVSIPSMRIDKKIHLPWN